MKVAIMGSGGLGGFFGGLLARAGEDVTFIARGPNLAALRRAGLRLVLASGDTHVSVRATDNPADVGAVDLVWCCVKTYDLEAAARAMVPLIGPATMVLPIQNCVDAAERLAAVVGPEAVLGGLCRGGATLEAPGVVVQKTGRVHVVFGERTGGASPRTGALLKTLTGAGLTATLHPDVRVAIWEKFLGVCGVHGLTALTRLPLGPLFATPATRELVRGLVVEAEAVARAAGIPLPPTAVDDVLRTYEERAVSDPDVSAAIYFDLVAGRRLELEDMNGAAVRLGRRHGVATPLNFAVYAALKPNDVAARPR